MDKHVQETFMKPSMKSMLAAIPESDKPTYIRYGALTDATGNFTKTRITVKNFLAALDAYYNKGCSTSQAKHFFRSNGAQNAYRLAQGTLALALFFFFFFLGPKLIARPPDQGQAPGSRSQAVHRRL
jgi:hypothetical protein